MGFGNWLRGVVAQINPFDNGETFDTYNPRKKKDDQQSYGPAPSAAPAPSNPAQHQHPGIQVQRPQNIFQGISDNLRLPGSRSVQAALPAPQKTPQQELDEMTQKNLPAATQQVDQGQSLVDRAVNLFTHNNEKIAQQNARNKALNDYQETHDWNNDPAATSFANDTQKMVQNTSGGIKTQNEGINRFEQGAYKAANVAQYVPVVGSVMNLGLATADATGDKDVHAIRNKIDFGMNPDEYNQLDEQTKAKLETIRNIGLGLAPLDFTGIGGLAKSEGVNLAKQAIVQAAKRKAIDEATRQGLKDAAMGAVRTAVPAGIIGGGASAAAQEYLTGNVDPLEAAKAALLSGGTSMLIPNGNKVKVPGAPLDEATAMPVAPSVRQVNVQQPRSIGITDLAPEPSDIPVNRVQPQTRPIVEVGGDTPGVNRVQVPTANEAAATRFASQPVVRPDSRVEGIIRGKVEDTALYTKNEVDTERTALDQALANKEINKTQHAAATKELNSLPIANDPNRPSTPIQVKQVRDIPVDEMSSMPHPTKPEPTVADMASGKRPQNDIQTAIEQAHNAGDDTKAAGLITQLPDDMQQPMRSALGLPDETQAVLTNPRQFNQRQVASARNQRKLATQMAKTKEQTAEAIDRINAVSPGAQSGEGFVPTGEFGKSVNGGAYQKTSRAAEMQQAVQETANLSPSDVIRTARANQGETGGFNRRDIRNIAAMFEQKRIERGTLEWNEARQILKEDGTIWGQTGALRNYKMRRSASADELTSRFESKIYRLAEDPTKLDSKLFDEVDAAENNFVDTRDAAMQTYNRFTEAPTSANAKAYHAAQDAADKADKEAKMVEYKVAKIALKGNKDIKQARELEKMAQGADMYQMDAVDASMLSGTGTFVRNAVNAVVGGAEEGLLGRVSARIAGKITGQPVGGGFGRGSVKGLKEGAINVVDASKGRAQAAGKNPLEHIKNWATTGNQLGDTVIDAQISRNTLDHYTQLLKNQGFKGRELRDRASVMARQDPDNVSESYSTAARVAAGLGSGITRNNKIETTVKNIISDTISGGKPNKFTEGTAKLITRMTLGFPTAIGRSVAEGAKRFTLGAPTFLKAIRTQDPQQRALLIKEGIKQAGSGSLVIPPLFYGLGASGMITGAYPKDDPAEKDRWEREGISENSIKIGNDYYQLPAYLGAWALPGIFYASLGRNNGDFAAAAADTAKIVPSLLPTESISNITDVINGRTDLGKWASQTAAGAVRAATPAGALLNQIAKSLDPTQNDTNSGDVWENFVSKVISGLPGASMSLLDKTDSEGNVLTNPNPAAIAAGASSTEQTAGVQQTTELNGKTNTVVDNMANAGAFSDPNLKAVVTDPKVKKIYSNIIAGKQVSPDDLKKVQEAMVKGVSEKGTDTAYLEKEQYDTNLTALQVKRELMSADPTTKPSDLNNMDIAIKRGQVYKDKEVPYELIKAYQDTSLSDWRKMGDPESDEYDPEGYQQLWAIDEMMAKAGVSYAKNKLDKQKYSAKEASKGRGGSKTMSTDFGTLKPITGGPSVQQYDSLDQRTGAIPVINAQRPNIVHKIGFSG